MRREREKNYDANDYDDEVDATCLQVYFGLVEGMGRGGCEWGGERW